MNTSTNFIQLRPVLATDLPIFFQQQQDPDANYMAAFTSKDPTNKAAFETHWSKIMANEAITIQTILYKEDVAGHIASFPQAGEIEITYWIGKRYWGKGVATNALTQFLKQLTTRPLYARVAKDNIGSQRVLEKCGFGIIGADKGFANARATEVEEWVYRLI